MKRVIYACLLASSLQAMEMSLLEKPCTRQAEETFLRLHNTTNDILLVSCQWGEEQAYQRTLIPDEYMDFIQIGPLASLSVKAAGAWNFRLTLPNLMDIIHGQAGRFDALRIRLAICPRWNSLTTQSIAAFALARLFERVLPYTFSADVCEPLEIYTQLDDAFFQVKKALQNGVHIRPLDFLSVEESATAYDCKKAYENLRSIWRSHEQSEDPEMQRFARDVIDMILLAYQATVDKEKNYSAFQQAVQRHFTTYKQKYRARPSVIDPLRRVLTKKGREFVVATSLNAATAALRRLKQDCPRFAQIMRTPEANELFIVCLAKKFLGSQLIEPVAQAAFSLGTDEAQSWIISKISDPQSEWQKNHYVIFYVFKHFDEPFYKPLGEALAKDERSLNMRNPLGNTPLMEVILHENFEAAHFLITHNADRAILNKEKKRAYDLGCEMRKHYEGIDTKEARAKLRQWNELITQLQIVPWQ